jgi:hypothetical protein
MEPRFDGFEPCPIPFRHHYSGGLVERLNVARDRSWGVGLGKMGDERPHACDGEPLDSRDFQGSRLIARQKS